MALEMDMMMRPYYKKVEVTEERLDLEFNNFWG